jgi:hypothetical protein
MIFSRELILIASSIQLSVNINMESLHIVTVLRRDQEDYQRQQDSRTELVTCLSDRTTTSRAPSASVENMNMDELMTLFTSDSWLQFVSSFCTCQHFKKKHVAGDANALSQSLFCSCLAKYSLLDPDGTIRLKLLIYLIRIHSALNTSQANHFTLRELT